MISRLKEKIFSGEMITEEEAYSLKNAPLKELCVAADEIRRKFCGDTFDMCTIINGKSGKCSENCKYCAQSSHYCTQTESYPLLETDKLVEQAVYNFSRGVLRYSIVCSGKRISDSEVEKLCESIRAIKKVCGVSVCVSVGLLDEANFRKLKEAGAERVHNNLETSERFFPEICTTHTFDDKLNAIAAAKRAGLEVCSGGIIGLGETMDDRISMAFKLRSLGVRSVPVNMLNPIPNTPLAENKRVTDDEMARTVAIFRFIIPNGFIRLAGGRGLMSDKGKNLFMSGANAAISGDMLTTAGITIETDKALLEKELGYTIKLMK